MGLAFSLILLVLALTGSALVYKDAYWRAVYPALSGTSHASTPAEHAAAIGMAAEMFGDELRSVKFPHPGLAGYHLYLADGEAFITPGDHVLVDRWRTGERLMSWLFDLHAHLMAGETGEKMGGVIGLIGVGLAITGIYLWWPTRKRFSLRHVIPRSFSRHSLIAWHRDLGLITAPLVLLLLLTGSGMVFYATAESLLNGIFGDEPADLSGPSMAAAATLPLADSALVARVQAEMPGARIVFYYPPAGAGYHRFRLKMPCEMHPNGRSFISFDGDGAVIERADGCSFAPGQRATHAIYPLHAGKTGSELYALATFLGGLVLAGLAASGAVTYAQKLRR